MATALMKCKVIPYSLNDMRHRQIYLFSGEKDKKRGDQDKTVRNKAVMWFPF